MLRQGRGLLQDRFLVCAERDELERNREPLLEAVLRTEFGLQQVVEVDAARLELGTDCLVDAVRGAG
jgi:hypothetical protein